MTELRWRISKSIKCSAVLNYIIDSSTADIYTYILQADSTHWTFNDQTSRHFNTNEPNINLRPLPKRSNSSDTQHFFLCFFFFLLAILANDRTIICKSSIPLSHLNNFIFLSHKYRIFFSVNICIIMAHKKSVEPILNSIRHSFDSNRIIFRFLFFLF